METILEVPQGKFELQRLPHRKNELLRAWDAADEYLLQYLFNNGLPKEKSNIIILNDRFGALSVTLSSCKPTAISDSWLSQQATRINLTTNNLALDSIQLKNSLDWPKHMVDLVLIKVPKTLALLEDQLIRLQSLITTKTTVITAGMVKAMPAKVWKLMDQYLGTTTPSLAKKKARLIFTTINLQKLISKNPYPTHYPLENTTYRLCNHANVFSRASLDIGTRFLLKHLPQQSNVKNIVDLGCGNGIVGLMLAQQHPSANLYFVDESYMAVASAKENFHHAYTNRQAEFIVTDGLTEFKNESMDLVICNPPFHQQNTVGNQIAISLFKQSHRVLQSSGQLWVIGNRHLGYHNDLKRIFNNYNEIASNTKFIIWRVTK